MQELANILVNLSNAFVNFFSAIDVASNERDQKLATEIKDLMQLVAELMIADFKDITRLKEILFQETNFLFSKAESLFKFEFDRASVRDPEGDDNPFEMYPDPQGNFYFLALSEKECKEENFEKAEDYIFMLDDIFKCCYEMDRLRRMLFKLKNSKTSRNAPCPCGSGKKFKQCHGF